MKIFTEEFKKYFVLLNKQFTKRFRNNGHDKNTEIVYATLKLGEEFGELSEAVLSSVKHQRQEKIDIYKDEDLETEIADVIIQTLVVADLFNIDVEKSLSNKFEKLEIRAKKF